MDLPWEYGFELFIKSVQHEEEDRLYQYWVAYFNNGFGGKDRKNWYEFKNMGKKNTQKTTTGSTGKITGVDLARIGK